MATQADDRARHARHARRLSDAGARRGRVIAALRGAFARDVGRTELLRTRRREDPRGRRALHLGLPLHAPRRRAGARGLRRPRHRSHPHPRRARVSAAPRWRRARIRTCPDVRAVENYIACNTWTRSELVVLIRRGDHDPGSDRRGQRRARSLHAPRRRRRSAGGGRAGRPAVAGGDSVEPRETVARVRGVELLRAPDRRRPARRRAARRPRRASRLSPARLRRARRRARADLLRPARRRPVAVPRDVPVGWTEQVADLEALRAQLGARPPHDRRVLLGRAARAAVRPGPSGPGGAARAGLARSRLARGAGEVRAAVRPSGTSTPSSRRSAGALRESGLRERDPAAFQQRIFELSVAPYFHDPARARELTPFRVTGRTQQEVWASLGDFDLRAAAPRRSAASPRSCSTARATRSRSRPPGSRPT